jgi:hypothetical protein
MSLAISPFPIVQVTDPRIDVGKQRSYAVLEGGSTVSWKPNISTSYSTSSIQFSAPPPNPRVLVDREVKIVYPIQLSFTGTSSSGNLLQIGSNDALRAYPISSTLTTLAVTINNSQVSINMSDVIQALLRVSTDRNERGMDYSLCPAMVDQSASYDTLLGSVRNPLGFYGDNTAEEARGGFPLTIVSNTPTSAVIQAIVTESIYLSPFLFSKCSGESSGFIGVQTLDFTFTLGNLARMWSHNAVSGNNITAITPSFFAPPQLLFNYITPKDIQLIPDSVAYPYYEVDRYPTPAIAIAPMTNYVVPNNTVSVQSNNIQLNSIPRRIYVFARQQNSDQTYNSADFFARIVNISVNWNNNSGLLSSATEQDLWRLARKNGVSLSWPQWTQYVGSVLPLEMGTDIGLGTLESAGLLGTFQLQMTVTLGNIHPTDTINFSLYVMTISEGAFTITQNRSIKQVGVISRQDVLDAGNAPAVNYQQLAGGDFFSGLKSVIGTIAEGVQKALPIARVLAPVAKTLIPGAAPILSAIGMGRRRKHRRGAAMAGAMAGAMEGGRRRRHRRRRGGVLVGGKLLSRDQLAKQAGRVDSGEDESDYSEYSDEE